MFAPLGTATALCLLAFSAAAGGPPVIWQSTIEPASGPAIKGRWRQNNSDYRYLDDTTVAIDGARRIAAAWVDNARHTILFQRYDPVGNPLLPAPVDVSRSPGIFSWLPRLKVDPDDPERFYMLWQEIVFSGGSHGGEIFFAASRDGGRTWTPPRNLTNSHAGEGKGRLTAERWHNGSLDLALGPDDALYAAWTEYAGRLWVARSADRGASFAPAVHVAGDSKRPARGPSLAVGKLAVGRGKVYLAWTVGEDRAANIQIAVSGDGGKTFGPSRPVAAGPGHADAPKLALDRHGALHLVYGEAPPGSPRRYRIRHVRSTDGGRTFSRPVTVSKGLGDRFESSTFPHLAFDGEGTLIVVWNLFPRAGFVGRGLGYAVSRDNGGTFSPAAVIPGSSKARNGGRQGLLMQRLGVNANGEIAIGHSSFDRGAASRILIFRGRIQKK